MTTHNTRLQDFYTDYAFILFGAAAAATGWAAALLPELSHDQITRFLSQRELTNKDLRKIAKPHLRYAQSEDAVLIIDDTVAEKPCTDEDARTAWHFDHNTNRSVKGTNFLSVHCLSQDTSLLVAFELICAQGKLYQAVPANTFGQL